jgi:Holliday junction resolvasome RuvABC endonuclease subunit
VIVLGIDPGPETCGIALYDTEARAVASSHKALSVKQVIEAIRRHGAAREVELVALERVQSYGIAGSSLLRTSEVVGRLWQAAERESLPVRLLYRREILRALDVTGRGSRDALVRQRLLEIHGGTKQAAVGNKKAPGPLYGVASHAWAALAVAVVGGGAL